MANAFQQPELLRLAVDLGLMGKRAELEVKGITEDHIEKVADVMRATVEVRSGATRDSVTHEVMVKNGVVTGEAGPSTRQAVFLEWGTTKMSPEPFAGPALEEDAPLYEKDIADATVRRW